MSKLRQSKLIVVCLALFMASLSGRAIAQDQTGEIRAFVCFAPEPIAPCATPATGAKVHIKNGDVTNEDLRRYEVNTSAIVGGDGVALLSAPYGYYDVWADNGAGDLSHTVNIVTSEGGSITLHLFVKRPEEQIHLPLVQ